MSRANHAAVANARPIVINRSARVSHVSVGHSLWMLSEGKVRYMSMSFCSELGPLQLTCVASPPQHALPVRCDAQLRIVWPQVAGSRYSCNHIDAACCCGAVQSLGWLVGWLAGLPSARPLRLMFDLNGSLLTIKCAIFGTNCPAQQCHKNGFTRAG